MRVRTLKVQHLKQIFQFVLLQFGMQQTHESQRVEILRVRMMQIKVGRITTQIEVKYVIVVVGIMSKQSATLGISHKLTQRLLVRQQFMVLAFLNNRIHNVAKHGRNLLVGFDIYRKLRPFHHLAVLHLHGSYLQDVVFKHIQSSRLGIKHHYRVIGVAIDKSHKIGRIIVAQQVRRQYGTVEQVTHKLTCSSIALIYTHTLHQSCPRHKAELIVEHTKMSQQKLHIGL